MTTRAEWAKRVERWRDSGLTAKEFATETGVKASSLSFWKWKLSADSNAAQDAERSRRRREPRASGTASSSPTFVEVEVARTSRSAPLELVLPHGLTLRIPVGFDEDTLRRALSVFEALR
jgi:transposase